MKFTASILGIGLFSLGCVLAPEGDAQAVSDAVQCEGVAPGLGQEGLTVTATKAVKREVRIGKATVTKPAGAELYVRAEPGLSAPYLQRVLDCQRAREGGLLGVADAVARVTEGTNAFVVRVEAPTVEGARQVQQSAASLVSR